MKSWRILLVDDEVLISLDMAQQLTDEGFCVVGPARSVPEALKLVHDVGCDAAVLDVNLGRGTAEPVAAELIERSLPFVVVSGYASQQHPQMFQGRPTLGKPVHGPALAIKLRQILSAEEGRSQRGN